MTLQPHTIWSRPDRPLASLITAALVFAGAAGAETCGVWETVDVPGTPGYDIRLEGVAAFGPNDAWAVGQANIDYGVADEHHTLTMHWGGQQWSVVPSPNPGLDYTGGTECYLNDVAMLAGDDVWAVGHFKTQNVAGHVGPQPLVLHWDGSDWQQVDAPFSIPETSGAMLSAIAAIAPDDIWAGGLAPSRIVGQAGPVALLLHWDGSEWSVFEAPYVSIDGHQIRGMTAIASDDVWAVGSAGNGSRHPYVIHWDGSDWTHIAVPEPAYQHRLHAISALAADDIWIAGEQWDTDISYQPFMLHYDGSSWTEFASAGGGRSLAAVSTNDVWSADEWTTGGSIGHWDGTAWSVVESVEGPNNTTLLNMAVVNGCDVWGVGRMPFGAYFRPHVERLGPTGPSGDLDGDGDVDQADLGILLSCYGTSDCGDLDGDGDTDQADLGLLLANYGG